VQSALAWLGVIALWCAVVGAFVGLSAAVLWLSGRLMALVPGRGRRKD